MKLSLSAARRLGAIPRKAPPTDLARKLARDYRERYENALAAQLDLAGLPYARQLEFLPGRKFKADFLFHDGNGGFHDLIVEVDGALYAAGRHSRGAGREADMERDALAMLAGWRVLRVSPRQVMSGEAVEWIKGILGTGVRFGRTQAEREAGL